MKINHSYLKKILDAFEASDTPTTDIEKLKACGLNIEDDQFIFHLQIIKDKKLIEGDKKNGIGYCTNAKNENSWLIIPLRLTAQGHDFIEALNNKEVWKIIKSDFKEASIETILRVSKDLLDGFVKKKIEGLIGE